jgi:hypothetical protein
MRGPVLVLSFRSDLVALPGTAVAALLLASCNSPTDTNGSGTGSTDASATGVWTGTDSVTGLAVTAFIDSAGQAVFIRADAVQFTGTVQVSGTTLAVTVDGYSNFPSAFSDNSTYGIGTLNGTVQTATGITATLTFNTNGGTALSGSWGLNFLAQSNTASSTGAVSGNYTDNVTGAVTSINSAGVMTSQNPNTGCVLNGSISTNDSSHDIYQVAFSYSSCAGSNAVLNGVQFTGLASLNSGSSPVQLGLAVTGAFSTAKYGIVTTLTGS